tara:strand:+ start:406 stop:612 length:207 start_codon:yes stop_codon:yes gene_type:complete
MSLSKKPVNENSVNGKPMNGKPMNDFIYQSIMGEYLIHPSECLENLSIQKAISLNDEVMLRKILECEF